MIIQGRPMPKPAQAGESLIRLVIPAPGRRSRPLFAQMLVPISALGCVFSCGRCKHIHPAARIVNEKPFTLPVDLAEHLVQQRLTLQGKVNVIAMSIRHEPQ